MSPAQGLLISSRHICWLRSRRGLACRAGAGPVFAVRYFVAAGRLRSVLLRRILCMHSCGGEHSGAQCQRKRISHFVLHRFPFQLPNGIFFIDRNSSSTQNFERKSPVFVFWSRSRARRDGRLKLHPEIPGALPIQDRLVALYLITFRSTEELKLSALRNRFHAKAGRWL